MDDRPCEILGPIRRRQCDQIQQCRQARILKLCECQKPIQAIARIVVRIGCNAMGDVCAAGHLSCADQFKQRFPDLGIPDAAPPQAGDDLIEIGRRQALYLQIRNSLAPPGAIGGTVPFTAGAAGAHAAPALPDTPLFSDFSVTWRKEMAPQWRRQHRDSVDATFDAHLLAEFGDRPVGAITKADVLTFRAKLAELPGRSTPKLTSSTINKTMGLLRQCLTEASERFGTPDAFKGVKRLKGRRPDVKPFSLAEVEKIRTTIRPDFRHYMTCRFFTGMRTGEINGLKWKYVDFEHEVIRVREVFSAGEAEENAKTESSIRDIPMLPMVKDALMQHWEARDPDNEYVFTTREGNPIDAHNFANRIWYPLLRYLELEKRRPYQTRHTTATLMLASGENPEWIARLMGHTNTQMLFTVYSRFVPNLTRQDGLAFSGLVSRSTSTPPGPPSLL